MYELLVRGVANTEIAGRLVLSNLTVKAHVAWILAKLGVRDRVQVAAHACETGVVRPGEHDGTAQ